MKVELSELAKSDLKSVLDYTRGRWGERQMRKYSEQIIDGLDDISANPLSPYSKSLEGKKKSIRFLRVEKHRIFYTIEKEFIFVNRILHAQMNPDLHL